MVFFGKYSIYFTKDFPQKIRKFWSVFLKPEKNDEKMMKKLAVRGIPGKTKLGELSVVPTHIDILSPCIQPLPEKDHLTHPVRNMSFHPNFCCHGVQSNFVDELQEIRFAKRHLDLLTSDKAKDILIARSKVNIMSLRRETDVICTDHHFDQRISHVTRICRGVRTFGEISFMTSL